MSFLGPDVKLKSWKQRWWWREHRPAIIAVVLLAVGMVLAVLIPLAVTGAFDDDHKPAQPSGNSNSDPTTAPATPREPAEKPPELPDTVRKPTPEGIEATVRFKYAALNYGQRTGDYEPLKRVYDTGQCRACALLIERLTGLASRGRHLEGADYVVSNIKPALSPREDGEYVGVVIFSAKQLSDYVIVDQEGNRLEIRKAQAETEMNHELSFSGGSWKITSSNVNLR
jgi:hypothetical protein